MSNNKIRLRIVTPTRQLYDNQIDMVIMRSTSGDVGILHGHQPLTTTLDYGLLRIAEGDKELTATVFGGFADVQPDCITILSDAAEWPDEIDKNRALAAKERAEKRLKAGGNNTDIMRAELALRRALVRLEAKKEN